MGVMIPNFLQIDQSINRTHRPTSSGNAVGLEFGMELQHTRHLDEQVHTNMALCISTIPAVICRDATRTGLWRLSDAQR